MKKIYTLTLLLLNILAIAQNIDSAGTCRKPNHVLLETQSIEHNTKTGSFTFTLHASVNDTAYIDSIKFDETGMFSPSVANSFSSAMLLPNNTYSASIALTLATASVPLVVSLK